MEKDGSMNIEHLREFEYLAENLSFRDTARHFFVSPSVISRHISAMEDELGTKLFVRSKQSVAITDAGTVFLDRSKAILSEYNAALAEMSRLDEGGKPVVRLGYLHNAARPFILQFTSYLKEHYPEIEIEFKGMPYKMLYTALDDNRADLNIMLNVYSPHQQRLSLIHISRWRRLRCPRVRQTPLPSSLPKAACRLRWRRFSRARRRVPRRRAR